MGSRGSVIPLFMSLEEEDKSSFPITDMNMTRFMITLEEGVELVWHVFKDMVGGEIYVKKIPSMKITDIAEAVNKNAKLEIIGMRPGEKIYEEMISLGDGPYTYEYKNHFKILPSINDWNLDPKRINNGVKVSKGFTYSSEKNTAWMSVDTLKKWIENNKEFIGKI